MKANHPHLTTQKSFYVEISRGRHRGELVTDNRNALGEHLEVATGERDFDNTRRRHSALDRRTPDALYFDHAKL